MGLGRCAAAWVSKHVVQHDGAPPHFSLAIRDHLDTIWATVNRSWWPDCLACTFSRLDPARLLPVTLYEIPVASKEDLLARVMAAADVG